MGETTYIQWCHHTFNPWIGCTKVSPGCAHCYAEENAASKFLGVKWGKGRPRHRTSADTWNKVRGWDHAAANSGCRRRVFCASLADWLDDEVPIEWLADLLRLIHETPHLDWILLTKRPENFFTRVTEAQTRRGGIIDKAKGNSDSAKFAVWLEFWRTGAESPTNVWFGVSVEDQKRAEERIPLLLKIPARVRFLSVEPMLGPVDLLSVLPKFSSAEGTGGFEPGKLHWVIFGGESGKNARPCQVEWIPDGLTQCRAAGVAPFVKQLGSNCLMERPARMWLGSGGPTVEDLPLPLKLKHSKGGDMSEWPEDLRVREFPKP